MHSSRHRSSPYYSYTETSTDITESVPRPRFHSNGIGSDQKSSRDVVEGHLIPNLDTRDASESELEKPRSHGVHNDNFSVSQEKWDDDERRRQRFHRPGPSKRQLTSAHCMSDQESLSRGINRSASKERCRSVEYVPKAQPYRSGVLSNILMLYNDQERGFNLDEDLASSLRYQPKRALEDAGVNGSEDTVRIQLHIAEILARHQYLQDLCRAFMAFGAPTHRLEGISAPAQHPRDISKPLTYSRMYAIICPSPTDRRGVPLHAWLYGHIIRRPSDPYHRGQDRPHQRWY